MLYNNKKTILFRISYQFFAEILKINWKIVLNIVSELQSVSDLPTTVVSVFLLFFSELVSWGPSDEDPTSGRDRRD